MRVIQRAVIVVLAAGLAGCLGHTEYMYAHAVSGVVVDADGRPVAGAQVTRVDDAGADFGIDILFARTTDADGRFVFEHRGLAGSAPAPTDLWLLLARDRRGAVGRARVIARWQCGDGGPATCPGFAATGVIIRLGAIVAHGPIR